ncbi:MAG: hypothetical protein JNK88_10795, partial [Mangrovicoccus sp.]|nr:hypothetical protein [Mangrovicoccus sp.]
LGGSPGLDLATAKQADYLALLQAVEARRPAPAVAAMTAILAADEALCQPPGADAADPVPR